MISLLEKSEQECRVNAALDIQDLLASSHSLNRSEILSRGVRSGIPFYGVSQVKSRVKAHRALFAAAFTAIGYGQVSTAPPYQAGTVLMQSRSDLPCTVTPIKPVLTFDLSFRSGYEVSMPMKTLDPATKLTVVYRVTARDQNNHLTYFVRALSSSSIDWSENTGTFNDMFALGEGRYHIDWSLEDRHSHVLCATSWDAEAALKPKEEAVRPWLQPRRVQPIEATLFEKQPQSERKLDTHPLKLDIIVNFAPQDPRTSVLKNQDLVGLVGILRTIARDPHIREYSLVACSVEAQEILFRQDGVDPIDFPGLGAAVKSLRLGTVDLKQLFRQDGPAQFVASVLEKPKREHSDALIIVGPKLNLETTISRQLLESLQGESQPVFYLNYYDGSEMIPWRDMIGKIVKKKRGSEYTISRPIDLIRAWSDVIARLMSAKDPNKKPAPAPAGL
ncbi:MAG TPA: acetyltransferase [Bryobacteraceae bacterium]